MSNGPKDTNAALLARDLLVFGARALAQSRDELNAADAHLGDGDTGTMLAAAASAIEDGFEATSHQDAAALVREAADNVASSTGSSLGTLLALCLRSTAKSLKKTQESGRLSPEVLGEALQQASEKMQAAGGSRLGDKTIIDMIDAISRYLSNGYKTYGSQGLRATSEDTLNAFLERPCRIGRARLYPDRSAGSLDPGMLAAHIFVGAVCDVLERYRDR